MILDVLFIYCKENPNRGGYRQGMHELLAPFVHALETDAVNRKTVRDDGDWDEQLLEIADLVFIEHDAYILFTRLMDHAQAFYAIGDQDAKLSALQGRGQSHTIVERSKFIHEVCLQKVDPELASHLTSMDVLPQIFLM
jgi:TBC1 domain family member 5